MIKAGMKIRGGVVELVNPSGSLIAVYTADDLGSKGRILAETAFPGIGVQNLYGKMYRTIEYCSDYPEMVRRFNWHLTNRASAHCGH